VESVQQKHTSDRRQRASPASKQKSPKVSKRARSSSSLSDKEQQNTSKNKLSKQQSRASPEQPGEAGDRDGRQGSSPQHHPSKHVDTRRRRTPERRGNVGPERRQRSSPDSRSAVSPERRYRPNADKRQRGPSPDHRQARQNQQLHTRSRSNSSLSPKPAVYSQNAEHDRVDRRRAASPASAARHARKPSTTSPEPATAKEQRLTLKSSKIDQSSGMELTKMHTASGSGSDDGTVKRKRKELSGSEEVFSLYCFVLLSKIIITFTVVYCAYQSHCCNV